MLLDLAHYESPDLIQHSLLLLDRYYTAESDIFQKATKSQLLQTDQSAIIYNKVVGGDLIAYLRTGSGDVHNFSYPIEELTNNCWLEGEVEGFEPHQINQNIILSFGITIIAIINLFV